MTVERRFAASYRTAIEDEPGIAMDDDGTLWAIAPDGSRSRIVTESSGATGPQGTTGATGPGGGATGAQGPIGAAGAAGATGPLDAAELATVVWHEIDDPGEPPFLNGFGNAPGAWALCRFRLAGDSVVFVEGVVSRATPLAPADAPEPIFQLPPAAMPGGDLIFVVPSNSRGTPGDLGASFILIQADGTVCWNGYVGGDGEGASDALSVCCSFSMDAAP